MWHRVRNQVIIDVEIQGMDLREGPYPLPLKVWTRMGRDFVVATKEFEKSV